ncbi:MAG: pentapeptide repeat-containing protein [Bacteroidetes bacterium]|nr:pentapeptide repeat-containing protein [Bacteroidota bacterium]
MAISIDIYGKLYEIISNLKEYNSPEKLEDLKTELKFLKENDDRNSIYIADYGDDISVIVSNASPVNIAYIFCFPGFIGNIGSFHDSLRIVPVSTALSGISSQSISIQSRGYFAGAYLRDSDFASSDFSGLDLSGADLSNANLEYCNFTNAKIQNANFCGANLNFASLPDYADTIEEFKTVTGVGNWNGETTIWTDGLALDGYRDPGPVPAEEPHE